MWSPCGHQEVPKLSSGDLTVSYLILPAWFGKGEGGEEREKEEQDHRPWRHSFTEQFVSGFFREKRQVANYILMHQHEFELSGFTSMYACTVISLDAIIICSDLMRIL